jgi:SAM-dependent methyltransferase
MRRELLVGCGNARNKQVRFEGIPSEWENLTTLDIDPETDCDVVHDLNVIPYPFEDNSFDEIAAYEVLEHCGTLGDWKFFFAQFYEFWRILKPGGHFVATVPMWDSPWMFGDPGHTRAIPKQSLIFLNRKEYEQVGKTSMTDYSRAWKGDFETVAVEETEHRMAFVLKANK